MAQTAADMMSPFTVSISAMATLPEGAALLTEKNVGAIPVVDEHARPIGVLSRTDLVAHDCHPQNRGLATQIRDIMTPVVFSVAPDTSAKTVIEALLSTAIHQLFVTDEEGHVIGAISLTEVLRQLHDPQRMPDDDLVNEKGDWHVFHCKTEIQ